VKAGEDIAELEAALEELETVESETAQNLHSKHKLLQV
jgi:hypothetical protein